MTANVCASVCTVGFHHWIRAEFFHLTIDFTGEYVAGRNQVHEIKHDGFRILARRDKDRVRLATRNGSDFTTRYPKIVTAVESLPVRSCVIDGEAIVVNERGLSVFEPLRHRTHDHTAVLCAFDLLESRRRPAGGDLISARVVIPFPPPGAPRRFRRR